MLAENYKEEEDSDDEDDVISQPLSPPPAKPAPSEPVALPKAEEPVGEDLQATALIPPPAGTEVALASYKAEDTDPETSTVAEDLSSSSEK